MNFDDPEKELAHVDALRRTGDVVAIYFSTGLILSGMRDEALRLCFDAMLARRMVEIRRGWEDGSFWTGVFTIEKTQETTGAQEGRPMKFKMGTPVRDVVTGFSGHTTGFCVYISGCNQFLVQPQVDKDEKFVEARWIDDARLEIQKGVPSISLADKTAPAGGPQEFTPPAR